LEENPKVDFFVMDGSQVDEQEEPPKPMVEVIFELKQDHLPEMLENRKTSVVRKETQRGTVHLKSFVVIDYRGDNQDMPIDQSEAPRNPSLPKKSSQIESRPSALDEQKIARSSKGSLPKDPIRNSSAGRNSIPIPPPQASFAASSTQKSKIGLPPLKNQTSITQGNFYHELCKRGDVKLENLNRKKSEERTIKRSNSSPKLRQLYFDKHPDFCVKQYRKLIDWQHNAPFRMSQVDASIRGTYTAHQPIASLREKGVEACGFCHTIDMGSGQR